MGAFALFILVLFLPGIIFLVYWLARRPTGKYWVLKSVVFQIVWFAVLMIIALGGAMDLLSGV